MNFKIIQHRKIYFSFSALLVVLSIVALSVWGISLGIDFTGGSLIELKVENADQFSAQEISNTLQQEFKEMGDIRVQPNEDGFFIRLKDLNEEEHQQVLSTLREQIFVPEKAGNFSEERFESIGPSIGQELKNKALWAIAISLIAIVIFIAIAFRKISKPVASWKYGLGAIIALAHDIIIVSGVFSVLSHFLIGFEADILFVTALLTILGYSVNDTIVVYDRTRENLIHSPAKDFEETVNKSVNETIVRSINTSLTTLLVLLTLFLLGGGTIKNFVLALMIGTVLGAYSSIFVASPLLVVWHKITAKK